MAKNSVAGLLTEVDSLFTTQAERETNQEEVVVHLPLGEISDFPNHPFKLRMDKAMEELAGSVKEHGVLLPALVRPLPGGGYQMVAGHRRKRASEMAERATIPCIIRNLTDDEAIIIMVDSNVQRDEVLPSEKAFAYKMKLEAIQRRQGERTDLTSATPLQKLNVGSTRELIAKKSGESHEQIRKYIRLKQDGTTIKTWTDSGSGDLRPGGTWYVESGHKYIVKTSAVVYDSNGKVVERPYKNSAQRSY